MSISAFGVARFAADRNMKHPTVCIQEINAKLQAGNISSEQVINIQVDEEFYHVFFRVASE